MALKDDKMLPGSGWGLLVDTYRCQVIRWQEDRFTGVSIQRSFLRCPPIPPEKISIITWCFTYVFIWNRGIYAFMPHCHPWRTVPLRTSSDQAVHLAPVEARTLWPVLQASVHSSLQKCIQTFVCCVSFPMLPVHGEFPSFLLSIVI